MNKKTTALTTAQYREIITAMREGSSYFRPNERVATALVLEGNLGLRISDIVRLRLADIVSDGGRYRLAITEQKTGKQRVFTVPTRDLSVHGELLLAERDRADRLSVSHHDKGSAKGPRPRL